MTNGLPREERCKALAAVAWLRNKVSLGEEALCSSAVGDGSDCSRQYSVSILVGSQRSGDISIKRVSACLRAINIAQHHDATCSIAFARARARRAPALLPSRLLDELLTCLREGAHRSFISS